MQLLIILLSCNQQLVTGKIKPSASLIKLLKLSHQEFAAIVPTKGALKMLPLDTDHLSNLNDIKANILYLLFSII